MLQAYGGGYKIQAFFVDKAELNTALHKIFRHRYLLIIFGDDDRRNARVSPPVWTVWRTRWSIRWSPAWAEHRRVLLEVIGDLLRPELFEAIGGLRRDCNLPCCAPTAAPRDDARVDA